MSDTQHCYHDYRVPDPAHQPMYLQVLLQYLAAGPKIHTILDAGCGDGNFTASLAEAGYRMFGIDLSEGGVQIARDRKTSNASFAVASVYNDFRGVFPECSQFDAVVSVEVIEHLYDPRRFMRCAHDSLKAGGMLILTTPYWGYLKNIVMAVTNRIDRALTPLWDGGHIKHWSYQTLRKLGEETGFEYVAFSGAGRRIPYLWNGMVMVFRKN